MLKLAMQQQSISISSLGVVRDKRIILHDITLDISPGSITGLIGPSGSGKTTLMRVLVGAQKITSGTATALGKPVGSKDLRPLIGYVTQSPAVYEDVTIEQNLAYFAAITGSTKQAMATVLEQVDLAAQRNQLVSTLSGGQRARVSLAIALLGNAQLLILDEPTVGLDPVLRQHLWELFSDLARQGRTLLVSSHVMDEAEQCQNIILLRDGSVLMHGPKQELLRQTQTQTVNEAFLQLAGGNHA
jgi:ABC-2 type transport system ATP-binding protein